jgi:CspA family cold shock protein
VLKGKIKKYFSFRGFGFIAPENSQEEIFFHVSNYPDQVQPEVGKDVEFEVIETPKGKEATNITILTDMTASEPLETGSPKASTPKIRDIKGVGKATEEKLRVAGFDTVESIVSVDADTVSEKTGLSSKVMAKLIASAKKLLE